MNSMADLFHAKVTLSFIREVFEVMRATPQHTYQILTKRSLRLLRFADKLDWPSNVWMGVSVEDSSALYRIDHLRHVPAAVRFLSCEPLLGPLNGLKLDDIHWVIAGGESGPNYRPVELIGCVVFEMSVATPVCRSSSSSGAVGHQRCWGACWMEDCGMTCLASKVRFLDPPILGMRVPC